MNLELGERLRIRAMIYVAAEPVPFFWPMRSFIHHNPLHGLEHMPFAEALAKGEELFHGRSFLPRETYQGYLAQGKMEQVDLVTGIGRFLSGRVPPKGVDIQQWLLQLLTRQRRPVTGTRDFATAGDLLAALHGRALDAPVLPSQEQLVERLNGRLTGERLVYESVDALHGTALSEEIDQLVIKICLDFFDEGQSSWGMPGRDQGMFAAWRELAMRGPRILLRGLHANRVLKQADTPEGTIAYVMRELGVDEDHWVGYFTRELSRLHGWAGFVRWRSNAGNYHWSKLHPADLVDYLALRLTLSLALLTERGRVERSSRAISEAIAGRTEEIYLRHELYSGRVLPAMAHVVETTLAGGGAQPIKDLFARYVAAKRDHEAQGQAKRLRALAASTGGYGDLERLDEASLAALLGTLEDFERDEGMVWLRAMEARAMDRLFQGMAQVEKTPPREKRPFCQALFCIDTRSERIRRHLEQVGDYQTFGIAGFFGVPLSFMELGKGSEMHLCPVLLTPKNLVLEMTAGEAVDEAVVGALQKAVHELEGSVLTPFVTVEAIGLLFGFDMVGKTIAPRGYGRWRARLHRDKPTTRLLLDKLDRERADSILRAVQRAMIVQAVELELAREPQQITDDLVRGLREAALGHQAVKAELGEPLGLDAAGTVAFVKRLTDDYRINPSFARLQLERLGRIGFSVEEQANFVAQALTSIGLTEGFSRFVLLMGHGSTSENNPYESALDCGACGGNSGLVSARALAQMANNPKVRRRVAEEGIDIPDDVWFVPAVHDTTTDALTLLDLDLLPPSHLIYLDRLRNGLAAASRLCAAERIATLLPESSATDDTLKACHCAERNAVDWSQVRPEWGLSRNAYFIIGRRQLTHGLELDGRAFLHSYDWRLDTRNRLLENILTGPLVVGQWINMEHYFSAVDNEHYGSGSKVYHNVVGRFGVMTGNLSDLRTGLPSQTVLKNGAPYHEPVRLICVIEAPLANARAAIESVVSVKRLVRNGWVRMLVLDPDSEQIHLFENGNWHAFGTTAQFLARALEAQKAL